MRVVFVLRGRPGLGHVIPGLALAAALAERGHECLVLTYSHGLELSAELKGILPFVPVQVPTSYADYPGLELYDGGLRQVLPAIRAHSADLVVLGGEYVLGACLPLFACRSVMLVNPEVFEANSRNETTAGFFELCFSNVDLLLPLRPYRGGPVLPRLSSAFMRLGQPGPFRWQDYTGAPKLTMNGSRTVLIANGGGIQYPQFVKSYSSSDLSPAHWHRQTLAMTRAALEALRMRLGPADEVHIFSHFVDDDRDIILNICASDERLHLHPPSLFYYEILARADAAILRAGAGAIADIQYCEFPVVLWPLQDHEEQTLNAQLLAAKCRNIRVAFDPWDISRMVAAMEFISGPIPAAPPTVCPSIKGAIQALERLGEGQ
jgi:Glycosyltransferase family 28 C-terminal domain